MAFKDSLISTDFTARIYRSSIHSTGRAPPPPETCHIPSGSGSGMNFATRGKGVLPAPHPSATSSAIIRGKAFSPCLIPAPRRAPSSGKMRSPRASSQRHVERHHQGKCVLPAPHPSATSSAIIREKPAANETTPVSECLPADISGISSSTTT